MAFTDPAGIQERVAKIEYENETKEITNGIEGFINCQSKNKNGAHSRT
jgi:hypothetical protein